MIILALLPLRPAPIAAADDGTVARGGPAAAVDEPPGAQAVIERRRHVMGTWLQVRVRAATRERAGGASEAALDAIAAADARLSTWRGDSELAAVNDAAAWRPVPVSTALRRDLSEALRWHRETSAAFSPGLGALVKAWDLRGRGRMPTRAELEIALWNTDLEGSTIDAAAVHFGRPGLRIDEGGFGKGAALWDGLRAATAAGAACVVMDLGGQVAQLGTCDPLAVGIADPDDRWRELATVTIDGGGVATSGQSERSLVINGVRHGHILDPRSGTPVPHWGSVTVTAADPLAADCLATALFVMGPDAGARWAVERADIEAVFVMRTGAAPVLRATPGLRGRLTTSMGIDVEWVSPVDARSNGPP